MSNAYTHRTLSPLLSLALAALMTLGLLGGVDALATQGQNDEALLARSGTLLMAANDAQPQS